MGELEHTTQAGMKAASPQELQRVKRTVCRGHGSLQPLLGRSSWLFGRLGLALLLGVWVGLSSGCVVVDRVVAKAATGYLADGSLVFQREADLQLAREAIPGNFKLLEILIYRNPHDRGLLTLGAQYLATYSYAFVEPEAELQALTDPDAAAEARTRASGFYLRGRAYGLRALEHRRAFTEGLKGGPEALEKGLLTLQKSDLPALFWAAFCWGSWVNLNLDNPEALADSNKVSTMMARALVLDPAYYYGGAHLFFGALASRLPESAGGNPKDSRAHFEEALRLSQGKLLMTKVFYARYYATRVQDRALFERLLQDVLGADPAASPDEMLANLEAQRRARFYLASVDEYFLSLDSPSP